MILTISGLHGLCSGHTTKDMEISSESVRWYKLGVRLLARGQASLAAGCFTKAIKADDAHMEAHFNLGQALLRMGDKQGAELSFRRVLDLVPAQADARVNLSGLLLTSGRLRDALEVVEEGLRLCAPGDAGLLHVQLNTVLRRLGRTREAIDRTWAAIERAAGRSNTRPLPPVHTASHELSCAAGGEEVVVFVMVQWGTKYGPEYVRRLAGGIRRELQASGYQRGKHYRLTCLTDNPQLLSQEEGEGLTCVRVPEDLPLTGWWVKAYLFSPDFPVEPGSRMVYIDLDTVVTGPLHGLMEYRGPFTTMSTSGMASEGREGGFNTSIMLWPAGSAYEHLYTHLIELLPHVSALVHKFDHWCEMVLLLDSEGGGEEAVRSVQSVLPGLVLDYRTHAEAGKESQPAASLVTFPLQPKPHECREEWVLRCWVGQEADEVMDGGLCQATEED